MEAKDVARKLVQGLVHQMTKAAFIKTQLSSYKQLLISLADTDNEDVAIWMYALICQRYHCHPDLPFQVDDALIYQIEENWTIWVDKFYDDWEEEFQPYLLTKIE